MHTACGDQDGLHGAQQGGIYPCKQLPTSLGLLACCESFYLQCLHVSPNKQGWRMDGGQQEKQKLWVLKEQARLSLFTSAG